jgi:hypothetical protein
VKGLYPKRLGVDLEHCEGWTAVYEPSCVLVWHTLLDGTKRVFTRLTCSRARSHSAGIDSRAAEAWQPVATR